jgi:biopolymer transport protein ExbD
MQFTNRKRRQAPTVIIVALIDVLIVVLIFLMVSTTFKKQPALKLSLPESKEAKDGAKSDAESVIVTIPKSGPLYFKTDPVTFDTLLERLKEAVRANPHVKVSIRADTDAPFGLVIKVRGAAKEANVLPENVGAFVKPADKQ